MAVWALGQIGGDRSRKVVESLVDSEDETLSATASEALDEMRFLSGSMDLLVYSLDDGGPGEVEFVTGDEEYESAGHDGDWEDDFIDLN